ncbi:MAG: glycosyltransferase family 39 protein, partial [Planctomycetales bacterium]
MLINLATHARTIAALTLILLAAYGAGRPLLRAVLPRLADRLAVGTWSVALGLLAFGMLLACLGALGLLHPLAIQSATWACAAWAVFELSRRDRSESEPSEGKPSESERRQDGGKQLQDGGAPNETPGDDPPLAPHGWLLGSVLAMAAAACLAGFLTALAPVTDGDALCYHLELPKAFLQQQALVYSPYRECCTYPLLTEMWFLWAIALDGPVCASLVHWALGALLICASVLLAEPFLGRPWALVAGSVIALTPGVTNQMTAPLNDAAAAAFCALALVAWIRGVLRQEGVGWTILSGTALGGALGIKYLALLFAASLAASWLLHVARDRQALVASLRSAALVAVLAASVSGLWYARAAWFRGNPVYPFFHHALTGEGDPVSRPEKRPLGSHPLALLAAPWEMTMRPHRFGGRGHQLGAIFLVALPGLLAVRKLSGAGTLLAVAGIYAAVCLGLRQNV